jgi:Tol biopolymer transport system component
MRRFLVLAAVVLTGTPLVLADQQASRTPATPAAQMLTVDSIMRGPKLVGNPPSNVRWSKDSTKVYFSWQKPGEERASTWEVNRDGTGLRQLTEDQARDLPVSPAGRLDRAGRRALSAEGGDVVIRDVASGERRFVTRTSGAETNPRWARNDTAVTFVRDGDLFLMSLDAGAASDEASCWRWRRMDATWRFWT